LDISCTINYLAHAYLSFGHPGLMTGNIISDFVKGKRRFDFPEDIQKGILLHRSIDQFTDQHQIIREAKSIFRPDYRLYSGAFVDVIFDHFLANDENEFTGESLFNFSAEVYNALDHHREWLPGTFAQIFPFMKEHNWLFNYRHMEGASRSIQGLVRRAKYLEEAGPAIKLFTQHYQLLQDLYRPFWTELKAFAREQYETHAGR
jgi:acyl carrier protein phosphodiesterase